jgi:hypothetical protein
VGVYQIQAGGQLVMVAANLADPAESAVRPRPELVIGGRKLEAPPTFVPSVSRAVWMWFALGALLLSLVEWGTYHRRITV